MTQPTPFTFVRFLAFAAFAAAMSAAQAAEAPSNGPPAMGPSTCVAEVMRSHPKSAGVANARQAIRSCLESRPANAAVCKGVPPQGVNDVMGIEAWLINGCTGAVSLTSAYCHEAMAEVADYCHANQP